MNKKRKIKKQSIQTTKDKKIISVQRTKNKIKDKDISLEKSFWTIDGKVLRNLKQAVEYLEKIKKSAYVYHINKKKNDFADWIKDVYQKKQIAEKIKKVKTPKQIANIIRKMIK